MATTFFLSLSSCTSLAIDLQVLFPSRVGFCFLQFKHVWISVIIFDKAHLSLLSYFLVFVVLFVIVVIVFLNKAKHVELDNLLGGSILDHPFKVFLSFNAGTA